MKNAFGPLIAAALAVLPLAAAVAQTQAPAKEPAAAEAPMQAGRSNQTIQRIHIEDAGSRIDELRVGGQTEQIIVQPKANVPPYEIKPAEGARGTAPAAANSDTNGSRVWNVLKF
ncbi:MAG: hypothetical protein PHR71_05250 [Polaromonas sp.]|nr:hypothetical protein [Polaromonas sp.]